MENIETPLNQEQINTPPETNQSEPLQQQYIQKPKNNKKIFLIGLSILIVLVLSYSVFVIKQKQTKTEIQKQNESYKIELDFAKYNLEKTPVVPVIQEYSISLSEIYNIGNFEKSLKTNFSESQKNTLISSNFFISQNSDKFWNDSLEAPANRDRYDDWTGLYKEIGGGSVCNREPENSVFVTSDFLLHVYHRLLEKEFEYIENKKMYPILKEMTDNLFAQAVANYSKQTDADNKDSYERIISFFVIPKSILDSANDELSSNSTADQNLDTNENILKNLENLKNDIPENSYTKAKEELNLILNQKEITLSPIFGKFLSAANMTTMQDYTQFTPRSHYNKNSVLRSYFRAMMWYGRNNFIVLSPELTRDALNISLLIKNGQQQQNWERIYNPTAFLVGKSDDLGINEYIENLDKLEVSSITSEVVKKIQSEMENYQSPQILSSAIIGDGVFDNTKEELTKSTKGFRFMGQRFTPDAFIFSSLTQGDEKADTETGQKLPSSATALEVMSIMGNKTADSLTQNWMAINAPDSDKILNKNIKNLKDGFSKINDDIWTQNIYWGWLYTLKSLNDGDTNKSGYPMFVKNDDWNKKSLQTQLGSWTELKHDTLLYAKQSYAEYGGGGDCDLPAVPKGYVEPNITFLDRLIALSQMTNDGLKNSNLIDDNISYRNENFIQSLNFFKGIAVKELQNETISDDDFEQLRSAPGNLNRLLSNFNADDILEKDVRSTLIADVHTDIIKNEILYEADGIPNYIYVAVKDKNGTRLTKGLVFNYYEFTKPIDQRLNDQTWQEWNYTLNKSMLPQQSNWNRSLIK